MAKSLVVGESPTKARTLRKLLSRSYDVTASMGHVRDLPKSQLGVDVKQDFTPKYIVIKGKGPVLKSLREAAKKVETIYMATDPDREGEAISWHLQEALRPVNKQIQRIEFHEVTKDALKRALAHPRDIDLNLVNAQQASRILDRLFGYKLSPLLWRKVRGGLSAGRVQSVAVRVVVDREREIASFKPVEYWTIEGRFTPNGPDPAFTARLVSRDGTRFGTPLEENVHVIPNEAEAQALAEEIRRQGYRVLEVRPGGRRHAGAGQAPPALGPVPRLRVDLEAVRGQPDGFRRVRHTDGGCLRRALPVSRQRGAGALPRVPGALPRDGRERRRERRGVAAGPGRGPDGAAAGRRPRPALHSAAAALHRSLVGAGPGGTRHRPSQHLRAHPGDGQDPRLRARAGPPPCAHRSGHARHRPAGGALPRQRGPELHGQDGRGTRRDRRGAARLGQGGARVLHAVRERPEAGGEAACRGRVPQRGDGGALSRVRPAAGSQARPLRRIHRLQRFPGVPLYPPGGHRCHLPAGRRGDRPAAPQAGAHLLRLWQLPGVQVRLLGPADGQTLPAGRRHARGEARPARYPPQMHQQGVRLQRGTARRPARPRQLDFHRQGSSRNSPSTIR